MHREPHSDRTPHADASPYCRLTPGTQTASRPREHRRPRCSPRPRPVRLEALLFDATAPGWSARVPRESNASNWRSTSTRQCAVRTNRIRHSLRRPRIETGPYRFASTPGVYSRRVRLRVATAPIGIAPIAETAIASFDEVTTPYSDSTDPSTLTTLRFDPSFDSIRRSTPPIPGTPASHVDGSTLLVPVRRSASTGMYARPSGDQLSGLARRTIGVRVVRGETVVGRQPRRE